MISFWKWHYSFIFYLFFYSYRYSSKTINFYIWKTPRNSEYLCIHKL